MGRNNRNWVDDNYVAGCFFLLIGIWFRILRVIVGIILAVFASQRSNAPGKTPDLLETAVSRSESGSVRLTAFAFVLMSIAFFILGATQTNPFNPHSGDVFVFLGLGSLILAGLCFLVSLVSTSEMQTKAETEVAAPAGLVTYVIHVPGNTAWEPKRALQLMEHLLFAFDSLIFRIVARHRCMTWEITDFGANAPGILEGAIRASYPTADVRTVPLTPSFSGTPFYRYVLRYTQVNPFVMPMRYVTDTADLDPLVALTQAMNSLREGEQIVYTLMVMGASPAAYDEAQAHMTQSTIHPLQYLSTAGIKNAIAKKVTHRDVTDKYIPEQQRVLRDKIGQGLYQASLLIQVESPLRERIVPLALVDSQVFNFSRLPYNALRRLADNLDSAIVCVNSLESDAESSAIGWLVMWLENVQGKRNGVEGERQKAKLILEPRELAALWHVPHEEMTASCIVWSAPGQVELPTLLVGKKDGIRLGVGRYQGDNEPIYMLDTDRATHLTIIGKSGVGKSTLLHSLIHQDIARGSGVVVIDPHGTLVKQILQNSIPTRREKDVVLLDMADGEYPPPLNPLRGLGDVRISQMISIIERLFPDTAQYARLSRYLRAALSALQADPDATIRDLGRVFTDERYRATLLANVASDEVLLTWAEYDETKEGEQRQIREPILSRISPFYGNVHLYPLLCHPKTLDFRAFIREKKIVLISLKMDEESVPEQERNLIGALLISRLQLSGMKEDTAPVSYIYIDEVQKFVTTSLDEMFSEARKFHLSLTVAHQFLGQLPDKTREAILGNVGATLMFQCGPSDARSFGPFVRPQFESDDLVNLNKFQAAVKLQYQGKTQPAFTLYTDPPVRTRKTGEERERRIRAMSRKQYTPQSRTEVLSWLSARYPRPQRPASSSGDAESFYDKG